ncbi:LysR family transcriptional regulator [Parendozoicomonas haliclonae]|uniref:HTH-type transcriptional regulator BenM n=1 Tax=Parendozoicomonas haliclonae TaxID=1960125 RepID=A0A1X7APE3_9GAMM|nr:LysR family transcriptional regulator [Parendozoicomonas haliclonae]SMA50174.1 HTH-type transcriptional regulator BenM [Parendozoicomonas haliclonae]
MYSLDHLRMLVETVETGSFSACARKIGKVQSAVSQGIASLEIDMNLELFDRTTRKPTLTPEGEYVLEFARTILRQVDDLQLATASMTIGEEMRVCLAVDRAFELPRLQQLYRDFSNKYPNTELEVLSVASPDIYDLVKSGRANVGLTFAKLDIDKDVELCGIGNMPFIAVCATDHPLAQKQKIFMHDVIPYRQLLLRGASGFELGHFPKMSTLAWYSNDIHRLYSMLISGCGWAYIPAYVAEGWISKGKIERMDVLFDHKPWSPPVEIVSPKASIGPVTAWVIEELKSLFDND